MTIRRFFIALAGLMAFAQTALAQAEIDRLAEELEQQGVELGKVVTRNPKTKKITKMVKTYEFRSKGGKYAEKLKQAFAKEAENSTKEIFEKGGREWTLIFDTDDCHMVYTLQIDSQKPDPRVELSIIITYGKQTSIRIYSPNIDGFDMEEFSEQMKRFSFDMDSFKVNMEKYRRDAKKAGKELRKYFRSQSDGDETLIMVAVRQ